jgi:predicted ester cyclase
VPKQGPRARGRTIDSDRTHTGPWGPVEPTGRRATFSGVNIFRFENGKLAEIWNHRDDLGLMELVGVPVYAGARPGA